MDRLLALVSRELGIEVRLEAGFGCAELLAVGEVVPLVGIGVEIVELLVAVSIANVAPTGVAKRGVHKCVELTRGRRKAGESIVKAAAQVLGSRRWGRGQAVVVKRSENKAIDLVATPVISFIDGGDWRLLDGL